MKLWTWIKSLSWIAIGGAIVTAIMMILGAKRSGKMEAEVAHDEERIKTLQKGTAADIQKAKTLQQGIDAKKIKAREVRKKTEKRLERIGEDESMADIAARFNGKRVRSRSDTAA
jgi:hypothetical protein